MHWGKRTLGSLVLFSLSQNCPGWSHEAVPAACLPWEEAEEMKQAWLHLLVWLTIPSPPLAGDPKQQLNSPWWGAWAELYCSSLCDNWVADKDLSLQHLPPAQNIQPCEKYFHNYDEKGGGGIQILKRIQTQLEFGPRDGLALTYPWGTFAPSI